MCEKERSWPAVCVSADSGHKQVSHREHTLLNTGEISLVGAKLSSIFMDIIMSTSVISRKRQLLADKDIH